LSEKAGAMTKLVLGIDEAGRGPVLGPMLIAGVLDTERSSVEYSRMGCKDSKLLPPRRREELAPKIRAVAKEVRFVEIPAEEIDSLRRVMSLNEVEAKKIAELIMSFEHKPEKVIIDSPDPETSRFAERLKKYLGPDFEAQCEHKADVKYPHVSAASIIAKVERDARMAALSKRFGELGSGYAHDPVTREWLDNYVREHGKLPPFARKSWETSKDLIHKQTKLGEYD
jgi:ribonuclease HII